MKLSPFQAAPDHLPKPIPYGLREPHVAPALS